MAAPPPCCSSSSRKWSPRAPTPTSSAPQGRVRAMLDLYGHHPPRPTLNEPPARIGILDQIGRETLTMVADSNALDYIGDLVVATGRGLRAPRRDQLARRRPLHGARRRRRVADRAVDQLPRRPGDRLPGGRAAPAVRRQHLRRRSGGALHHARARAADDGDHRRRSLRRRLLRRARHDEGVGGNRRPAHARPRSRVVSRLSARHRAGTRPAAAHRPGRHGRDRSAACWWRCSAST